MPCGIDKDVSVDGILGFRTVLMTDYGLYFFSFQDHVIHIRIQKGFQIFLKMHFFPDDGIKYRKRCIGISAFVCQQNLQQDSCLSKIFFGTVGVGSHNVHTDLRAGVATKHRAILYDGCSGSFSGSCDCRTDAGQAASHYYNFIFSGFTVN